jgi:hypothetical protein
MQQLTIRVIRIPLLWIITTLIIRMTMQIKNKMEVDSVILWERPSWNTRRIKRSRRRRVWRGRRISSSCRLQCRIRNWCNSCNRTRLRIRIVVLFKTSLVWKNSQILRKIQRSWMVIISKAISWCNPHQTTVIPFQFPFYYKTKINRREPTPQWECPLARERSFPQKPLK